MTLARKPGPKIEVEYRRHTGPPGSYGRAALGREITALTQVLPGSRNHALNRAAFSLFQLVAGGELDGEVVDDTCSTPAIATGCRVDDGLRPVMATIRSGARAGLQHPRSRGRRMTALRPYQIDVDRGIRRGRREHKHASSWWRRPASGKTVIAADVIRQAVANAGRVLVLAHRREIIAQTSQKLFAAGIGHGIIQAGFQPRPLERGAGRIDPDAASPRHPRLTRSSCRRPTC